MYRERYRAAGECARVFINLEQQPCESTHEYYERFRWYLDKYPYHGFQLHVLLEHFLEGMRREEQVEMDALAGGSIMDCTPEEVWYIIQDRAAATRPYTEYERLAREKAAKEREAEAQIIEEKLRQCKERRERARIYAAKCQAELDELEEIMKKKRELKSAPEHVQPASVKEEVILPVIKQAAEDVVEEELHVVPITSVEDVPTEEWSTPQCLDLIIKQDMVITCSPIILPISDILLSPPMQNDTIQKALRSNQVWGSLKKLTLHIPLVRTPMLMQKSEQPIVSLCVNWKTRKKEMRGSLEEFDTHTHEARARRQTQKWEKIHEALHRTWKRRKKGKRVLVNIKYSTFSDFLQESHYSTFGWKPGWNAWKSVSHQVTPNVRKPVRKFDGVHPWAPNIR